MATTVAPELAQPLTGFSLEPVASAPAGKCNSGCAGTHWKHICMRDICQGCYQCTALSNITQLGKQSKNHYRPNLLWIMADDLGYGEVGAYAFGAPKGRLRTPNLDQFARDGMRFTRQYAGYTVCGPSRTSFMTGYHSGNFIAKGLSGMAFGPERNISTLPALLKKAGYTTAIFGKSDPLDKPVAQGFDYFIGQADQVQCHDMYPRAMDFSFGRGNLDLVGNWKLEQWQGNATASREACMAHPQDFNYTEDVTQSYAMRWLRGWTRQENWTNLHERVAPRPGGQPKPFFVYKSYTVPHAGGWGNSNEDGAPVPHQGVFSKEHDWPMVEKDHAAVVMYLDGLVGQLVGLLKELKLEKTTLTIFASDNGAHLEGGHIEQFFHSSGGLRGQKRSLYEGGVRSPTMALWPGTVPAGRESMYRWAFWDVIPTFLQLAGVHAPQDIDGVSIVPALLGETQPPKELLYWTAKGDMPDPSQEDMLCYARRYNDLENAYGEDKHRLYEHWRIKGQFEERNPYCDACGKVSAGFAIISGEYKGVVLSCAGPLPSTADLQTMQVFHIKEDDREQHNLAGTPEGITQAKRLLELVVKAKLTCSCFQGRCLTSKTCVDDQGDWHRRRTWGSSSNLSRSVEHHARKGVLQKVIVA